MIETVYNVLSNVDYRYKHVECFSVRSKFTSFQLIARLDLGCPQRFACRIRLSKASRRAWFRIAGIFNLQNTIVSVDLPQLLTAGFLGTSWVVGIFGKMTIFLLFYLETVSETF
jgi:hypothetical protein